MKQYKDKLDNLHWTEAGKNNLMQRVQANAADQKSPSRLYRPLSKGILIAAAMSLLAVTAYATGALQSASEILSPIFGGSTAQTEIIQKIGRPIGAADTSDGITITADAIIGDSYNVSVVYTIANADGTPFTLPQNVTATEMFFSGADYGTDFPITAGGLQGSIGVVDTDPADGKLQIVEMISTEETLPMGKKLTAKFSELSYFDEGKKQEVALSKGNWKINYELNYENSEVTIPVQQKFSRDDLNFTVNNISLSPIGLQATYSVDATPQFEDSESGKASAQREKEENRFIGSIDLLITKKDGTVLNLTTSGGGLDYSKDGITMGHKGGLFNEIVPIAEIASVTVGDVVINVK